MRFESLKSCHQFNFYALSYYRADELCDSADNATTQGLVQHFSDGERCEVQLL